MYFFLFSLCYDAVVWLRNFAFCTRPFMVVKFTLFNKVKNKQNKTFESGQAPPSRWRHAWRHDALTGVFCCLKPELEDIQLSVIQMRVIHPWWRITEACRRSEWDHVCLCPLAEGWWWGWWWLLLVLLACMLMLALLIRYFCVWTANIAARSFRLHFRLFQSR